jgi:5-methylcytosine-specific restriction protein A
MTLAEVVHHIIPIKERPDLKLVPSNCQALCFPCHEVIHGRGKGT